MIHLPVAPWFIPDELGADVRLWLSGEQTVDALYLRIMPDNEGQLLPMTRTQHPAGWSGGQWWRARLPLDGGNSQTLYCFKLISGRQQRWLDAAGCSDWLPAESRLFRYHPEFVTPDWVPAQVFYQIFPDRFAASDASAEHRVQDDEYLFYGGKQRVTRRQWGEIPNRACGSAEFFGGDLAGVAGRLDYLQQLGVTALYLNPVFSSPSNHKYDTTDYFSVDPHLGGNEALAALSAGIHRRGMRLVLDAVFNHTSAMHPWLTTADSEQQSWYSRDEQGNPLGWKGYSSLPVLDFAVPAVADYFYGAEQSVLRHWLRPPYRIDGWRFDVIHMLGEGAGSANNAHHLRAMRCAMKQENPEAWFLGEHFSEATRWLQGDQEDGSMNYYGFAHPVRAWLAGKDISGHPIELDSAGFARWLMSALAPVPFQAQLCQLNQLDSHDTARFLTLLDGDQAAMRLAVLLQFCWIGVPGIYYGDEIGLQGGDDPDCRRCFPTDEQQWDHSLLAWYRQLAGIRRQWPALQRGALQLLHASGDVLIFSRLLDQQRLLVAINRSPFHTCQQRIDLEALGVTEGETRCLLSEQPHTYQQAALNLCLAPRQAALLSLRG